MQNNDRCCDEVPPERREQAAHGSPELDEDEEKLKALSVDPGPTFAELEAPLRWVSVHERNPPVDDPDGAVLVANARLGVILGPSRFTTKAGNLYAGTDHDGEPVWQIFCPYDSAVDINNGIITLGPIEVTHWLDGNLPPVPKE